MPTHMDTHLEHYVGANYTGRSVRGPTPVYLVNTLATVQKHVARVVASWLMTTIAGSFCVVIKKRIRNRRARRVGGGERRRYVFFF